MMYLDELLIVVDAGHGGWDNGASYEGRLEKDDNLRLALAVRQQLEAQGVSVLMTRDTDVFVTLQDRARIANEAGADLFVSLHRNSYTHQTPSTNGVENFIYLTAPDITAGRAAQLVLDNVVQAGVQNDRGVKRGNYYVLRKTTMPAMLLEMGYIINEEDNRLFDVSLEAYAAAIAAGVMQYFGLEFNPMTGVTPAPMPTPEPVPPPVSPPANDSLAAVQAQINTYFGLDMALNGVYDADTRRYLALALQMALNMDFGAGLAEDGVAGPATIAAVPTVQQGQKGSVVLVIQALLLLNGYPAGPMDSVFGQQTAMAVQMFQRDRYLVPDGIVGKQTITALLGI